MLTPEYLLRVSEGAEEISERLHNDIVSRIVERIVIRMERGEKYILTAQDKWQLEVLQDAGFLLEDIQKLLAERTGEQEKEILEAFEDAYKHERHVTKLIDLLVKIASDEKDNATQEFLWGFVREQVEEEANTLHIVEKMRKAGEAGLFFMDYKLGERD